MILQCLENYYERLKAESDGSAGSDIAEPGFSRQNISFFVELHGDGSLASFTDAREATGKRHVPRKLIVLGATKPAGQGINPRFLWDNGAYMLGFELDDPNPDRTKKTFEAFRALHLSVQHEINDPEYDAVCSFLRQWDPAEARKHPILVELGAGFGVFHIVGEAHYVHDVPGIRQWWQSKFIRESQDSNVSTAQCLVTGRRGIVARIHEPKIQGVNDAQPAGALLVSFNFNASESYGREQSLVAPVSKEAAFRYCVALNLLLDRNRKQRTQIADSTTVFWTDRPSPIESSFLSLLDPGQSEDETQKDRIRYALSRIRKGEYTEDLGAAQTRFYVLGLAPNVARISVRFWWAGEISQVGDRLRQHFEDLEIVTPPGFYPYPGLWQIVRETGRESKDAPPILSGPLMRAILEGTDYPEILFQSILRRIKADRDVSPVKAACIKAVLNRAFRLRSRKVPLASRLHMALEKDRPEVAYQLGRLFAVLEKTQDDAFKGGLNATIKDRFFSAASATPAFVFPQLIRMNQHHVAKLESKAFQVNADKRTQEIISHIEAFPKHLSLMEQGLFAIGYYHQRQDFFTTKADSAQDQMA